jgi:hypothetical protein
MLGGNFSAFDLTREDFEPEDEQAASFPQNDESVVDMQAPKPTAVYH